MVDRCKCSLSSLEAITKPEECICCKEIDRVSEVMGQLDLEDRCITLHPGFHDVCLNRWVLEVASLNFAVKEAGMKQSKFLIFIAGISNLRPAFCNPFGVMLTLKKKNKNNN